MSRAQGLIFALVGVSLGLSWYFARQGPLGPAARSQCLTHSDCQSSERCVLIPKGDGFATFGQCGELCVDDGACPNGWTCRVWIDQRGSLTSEQSLPAELPRVKACAHHTVQ